MMSLEYSYGTGVLPLLGCPEQMRYHASGLRIALYSHDTQGLGHMRRNLAIATALAGAEPYPVILMIAGAREVGVFPMPPGVDCTASQHHPCCP